MADVYLAPWRSLPGGRGLRDKAARFAFSYRLFRTFENSRLRSLAGGFLLFCGRRVLLDPSQGWRLLPRPRPIPPDPAALAQALSQITGD